LVMSIPGLGADALSFATSLWMIRTELRMAKTELAKA